MTGSGNDPRDDRAGQTDPAGTARPIHPISCEYLDLDTASRDLTLNFGWDYLAEQAAHMMIQGLFTRRVRGNLSAFFAPAAWRPVASEPP